MVPKIKQFLLENYHYFKSKSHYYETDGVIEKYVLEHLAKKFVLAQRQIGMGKHRWEDLRSS